MKLLTNSSKDLILGGSLENHSIQCPPNLLGKSLIKCVLSCINSRLMVQNSLTWSIGSNLPLYLSYLGKSQFWGKGSRSYQKDRDKCLLDNTFLLPFFV